MSDALDGLSLRALRLDQEGRLLLEIEKLQAPPGACTVVVGGGDAGKTLLARALAGSLPGARGQVRLNGRELGGPPSARLRAGLAAVPDLPQRLRGVNVAEALSLAARRGRRVSDALDKYPLLARRRALAVERLSGGEHQLLRLACAWVSTPAALVLDAPTTGLAATVVEQVLAMAREEAHRGAAVLWLDQPDAPLPAPAAHVLRGGRLSAAVAS